MDIEAIKKLTMDGVQARIAEINTELDSDDADLEALTAELDALEARKAALDDAAQQRNALRSRVAAGAGTPRAAAPVSFGGESRSEAADRLVRENRMSMPLFKENRSVLVSSGKLATPTAVFPEIGELPQVISSIIDDVDVIDASGTGSWKFPYKTTDAVAADVTEGSTIGGTGSAYDYVTINPGEWGVLDEISNQVKKMTPVAYAGAVQRSAYLALRKKAKAKITAAILASELAQNIYSLALDKDFVRSVVLGFGGDEDVGGQTKLYLCKADLETLGKVRGTNEKKPVFEITYTDANNGVIKDGGMQIAFSLNASLTTGTQLYGQPGTVKMLLWDNYEISTDDGGDYFKRNVMGVRGLQTAGADLTVYHGMQILHQAAAPSGE